MNIPDILAGIRWQDVVDIAIVSVLIYWIIILIKGTKAVQMIFGLALIVVAFIISRKGELLTFHWILNSFLSSIILVVIVIFQNDIRRALTTVGKNPFFSGIDSARKSNFLEELIRASVSLVGKNIGALIIIKNPEESINIQISGPVTLLRALSPREVRAVIDLADARPGLAEFAIRPEDITLPRGLSVTMISPASIGLRFERLVKRSFPVKVLLVGKPFEGFKLTAASVDPPVVEIVGAQTELTRSNNIPTQEIDISGFKGDSVKKVPLNLGGLHIKSITREEVNVSIRCAKVPGE